MPHNLNLKFFALRSNVVAKVGVVGLDGDFTHQLFNRHCLDIGDWTTSALVLTTIETRIIITANIFEYQTVGHLVKLERL